MNRYRDRQETSSRPGPVARSASPTRPTFVRSNTPSPEETMAARLRAENAMWPLNDDDDSVAPQAPSTPSRSAEPASAGTVLQSAITSPTFGTSVSTTASPVAGGAPNPVVEPFDARQKHLILYLALQGVSKAAIASILRSELPGSQVRGSKLRRYGPERWEREAERVIKAELEALIETGGEAQDWVHDAAAMVDRITGSANTGDWRNSVLVRARDYMEAARLGMDREDIKKARAELARKRAKEKKKALEKNMQQHVSSAGIGIGTDAQIQTPDNSFEMGSDRTQIDGSYGSVASEDDMLVSLVELQDNGMLCGQPLFLW